MRAAIGARRAQIARQFAVESLVLDGFGFRIRNHGRGRRCSTRERACCLTPTCFSAPRWRRGRAASLVRQGLARVVCRHDWFRRGHAAVYLWRGGGCIAGLMPWFRQCSRPLCALSKPCERAAKAQRRSGCSADSGREARSSPHKSRSRSCCLAAAGLMIKSAARLQATGIGVKPRPCAHHAYRSSESGERRSGY